MSWTSFSLWVLRSPHRNPSELKQDGQTEIPRTGYSTSKCEAGVAPHLPGRKSPGFGIGELFAPLRGFPQTSPRGRQGADVRKSLLLEHPSRNGSQCSGPHGNARKCSALDGSEPRAPAAGGSALTAIHYPLPDGRGSEAVFGKDAGLTHTDRLMYGVAIYG
jgi:hypothetical protein